MADYMDHVKTCLVNCYRVHLTSHVTSLLHPEEVEVLVDKVVLDVLQIVYSWFREHGGEWPTFDDVERRLYRYWKLDAAEVVPHIPSPLMRPIRYIDGHLASDEKIVLSLAGVKCCRGSDDDVDNFVSAIQWIVQEEAGYDPGDKLERRMPIVPRELAEALRLPLASDPNSVNRLMALLCTEGLVSNSECEQ
jgi:hypothetical protein